MQCRVYITSFESARYLKIGANRVPQKHSIHMPSLAAALTYITVTRLSYRMILSLT